MHEYHNGNGVQIDIARQKYVDLGCVCHPMRDALLDVGTGAHETESEPVAQLYSSCRRLDARAVGGSRERSKTPAGIRTMDGGLCKRIVRGSEA